MASERYHHGLCISLTIDLCTVSLLDLESVVQRAHMQYYVKLKCFQDEPKKAIRVCNSDSHLYKYPFRAGFQLDSLTMDVNCRLVNRRSIGGLAYTRFIS